MSDGDGGDRETLNHGEHGDEFRPKKRQEDEALLWCLVLIGCETECYRRVLSSLKSI